MISVYSRHTLSISVKNNHSYHMSIHVCQHIYPQTWNLNPNKIHCPANAVNIQWFTKLLPWLHLPWKDPLDIQGTNLGMSQLQTRLGSPGFFQKTDPGCSNHETHFGGIEQAANVWHFWQGHCLGWWLLFEGPMFNFHDYERKGNNHTKTHV